MLGWGRLRNWLVNLDRRLQLVDHLQHAIDHLPRIGRDGFQDGA